ncbi:MAG: zinc ribbon domain-containing protein [Algibacter sp.]|uniref:zinc ribbon domain-containing protein n=1 Tax=Algibacter sp. TaxID=1872428 RepID=UPI00329A1E2A
MSKIDCVNCGNKQSLDSNFCSNCGNKLKCDSCDKPLLKDANFCSDCGKTTLSETNNKEALNTIKFKETKDERSYELAFTDEVGKDVSELVTGMMKGTPIMLGANNNDVAENFNKELDDENDSADIIDVPEIHNANRNDDSDSVSNLDYPHLDDLSMKMDFSEKEWLIVYAFYLSNFGASTFSKESVYSKYKEERITESRFKNLGTNWKKAFRSSFKTQKVGELKFTDDGIKNVKSLISGNKKSNAKKVTSRKETTKKVNKAEAKGSKSSSKVIPKSVAIEKFDINSKKISLEKFLESIGNPKSTNERILAIGYYISEICGTNSFSDGNVDFAYKVLKLDNRPTLLRQTIANVKNRDFWIEKAEGKSWKLSRIGELHIEKLKSPN